jgi:hypothetical protein
VFSMRLLSNMRTRSCRQLRVGRSGRNDEIRFDFPRQGFDTAKTKDEVAGTDSESVRRKKK